jgi:hypothetical protein
MLLTPVGLQIELTHRTLEINGHNLEAAKEPVETLCREFWDPNGSLSPRRISPNPNLIFVVHANPNSPTDDMFLTSFVESFARYGRTEEPLASTSKHGVVSRGLSVVKNLVRIPSFLRNPTSRPSNTIADEACRGHHLGARQERWRGECR